MFLPTLTANEVSYVGQCWHGKVSSAACAGVV